ncbi:neuraminidase [Influenza B virus (B/Florida/06/2016)]|uniref:Neuraminidase n=1 Tax=Influenza B virus (B/Florida/06/2016) TaxID=1883579 RepID=A0A1B1XKY5_9INFB|nr:neuraminidase [Influenza B virus (B/Florida/06/2016)]AOZ83357.1 neuraminidase [Influenza B virus (B/Florida/06/2016)]
MLPSTIQTLTLFLTSGGVLLSLYVSASLSYLLYSDILLKFSPTEITAPTMPLDCANASNVQAVNRSATKGVTLLLPEPKWTYPRLSCPGSTFQKALLISPHRFGETKGNSAPLIIREPFVACGPNECKHFALTHYAAQPGGYYNGTRGDRNKLRHLISVKLGKIPTVENSIFHMAAWSGSACHDGKEWTYIGVDGPDNNALLKVKYGEAYTDTYHSYANNILRTQESACNCIGGNCYLMITDGSASGVSECRFLKIREGRIIKEIFPTGRVKHTEECTCGFASNKTIECACRDNRYTAKRPFVKLNVETDTAEIRLMCTDTYLDTPRPNDGSITGPCESDGDKGSGGIKGGFVHQRMKSKIGRWYSRTMSKTERMGMGLYVKYGGDPWADSDALAFSGVMVSMKEPGWYSFGFEIKDKKCDVPCIGIEMVHDGGKETWHSAATAIYCLMGSGQLLWDTVTGVDMAL